MVPVDFPATPNVTNVPAQVIMMRRKPIRTAFVSPFPNLGYPSSAML
jgi:hypothetical protein